MNETDHFLLFGVLNGNKNFSCYYVYERKLDRSKDGDYLRFPGTNNLGILKGPRVKDPV